MQQFHSLRSSKRTGAESSEEPFLDYMQAMPPTFSPSIGNAIQYTDPLPSLSLTETNPPQVLSVARPATPGHLHDVHTTQSLVSALQATMQTGFSRPVVVIPGTRKRALQTTEVLPHPGMRVHPHLRLFLVLFFTMSIFFFTLFSFTPLGRGQTGIPLFDGAISWAQAQQQNWSLIAHDNPVPTPVPAPAVNAVVSAPPVVAPMNLPTSQYIAIARQDAIVAGIPPDAFVRQINLESGFNPNAYSPAGAVGIAQFLPSTAAGLGINPYDPISALNGAARYMANLAGQFGGDYAKALGAYNAGGGNVQRAVNLGGANWLAYMPPETQNYVRVIMG